MRAWLLLGGLLLVGCPAFRSSHDPVARDQEIIRDVLWRYHGDERFEDIRVTCQGGVVTLVGRVPSAAAGDEAEALARVRDVRRVVNRLEIRPK